MSHAGSNQALRYRSAARVEATLRESSSPAGLRTVTSPTPSDLARAFDLSYIAETSLTPWAAVYKASIQSGRRVVVKKTASGQPQASALAAWTAALRNADVAVVAPIHLPAANPQQVGEDWWVVYPFVEGRPYRGAAPSELAAAGALLGQIHSAPIDPEVAHGLRVYEWPSGSAEDVENDLTTLAGRFAEHLGGHATQADAAVAALANRWLDGALPLLRTADEASALPRAAVSSDFKANNLVFNDDEPVLVDPDNGGFEPRLLDLALSVVLFHNECPTAPGRLFSQGEWQTFVAAYLEHVELTQREYELWPAALDHIWWEEGTWVLEDNDAEAWASEHQGAFLADLAQVQATNYPLPTQGR